MARQLFSTHARQESASHQELYHIGEQSRIHRLLAKLPIPFLNFDEQAGPPRVGVHKDDNRNSGGSVGSKMITL